MSENWQQHFQFYSFYKDDVKMLTEFLYLLLVSKPMKSLNTVKQN